MKLHNTIASAAVIALLSAGAAVAKDALPKDGDTFTKWGDADGWAIYMDGAKGSCLAERQDANGNILQMGATDDKSLGYIGVFTQADIGLKNGKGNLTVSIDGKMYEGPSRTVAKHLPAGYQGGYLLANNPVFIEDVMKKYDMVVSPGHANSFNVSLDGTFKAIEAARKCQSELGS